MEDIGGWSEPEQTVRRAALEILAISFVVLFQELTLIRWFPSQVRVLAYFPNLILIATFLGLGLGCLRSGRRSLLWLWPSSLILVVSAGYAMSHIAFTQNSVSEHLWLLYYDLPPGSPVLPSVHPPIIIGFILSTITFVPLGQLLAERLDFFRTQSSSLRGYCWDLLGSLLGVVAFAVVGFLGVFPWLWFALFLAVGLFSFLPHTRRRWLFALLVVSIPLGVHLAERAEWYSPYYAISVEPGDSGSDFSVLTNGSLHQKTFPLRNSDKITTEMEAAVREGYHHPYRQLKKPLGRVLVLGAGTGNDVAVLLDEGAAHIDAVEIDPVILSLGENHVDKPYASPRVRTINTDARLFLNNSDAVYDLIVFGTLDSQTRLSALSNVRLDNFVYTRESIEAARAHLAPDGGMVMYFMVATNYIDLRLFSLVAEVFNEAPAVRTTYSYLFNRIYMAGPAFAHLQSNDSEQHRIFLEEVLPTVELPSDDWPYLYLRSRSISSFYLTLILFFLVLAAASVFLVSREMRSSLRKAGHVDLEMFFFGVGFMLIETKFVTAMNLIWGATWLTSAVVFGSVLVTILLSTLAMEIRPWRWWTAAGGLLLTLFVTYLIPFKIILVDSTALKLVLSIVLVGTPVFFAAACFAMRFRVRRSAGVAFGWNLLGAVCGGLLEFLSMIVGLRALSLIAIVFYLGAIGVRERRKNIENQPDGLQG